MEKTVDGDGFAVGKKLSLAGILIYAFLTSCAPYIRILNCERLLSGRSPASVSADVGLFVRLPHNRYFDKQDACDNTVAGCPKLVKIRDQVAAVPGIAKWVAERPKTAF